MYGMDHRMPGTRMNLLAGEVQYQSRNHALLRQIKGERPGRLARAGGWLLSQLGSELVALGQWLERQAPARPVFREGI
jgi:hypothetical protein